MVGIAIMVNRYIFGHHTTPVLRFCCFIYFLLIFFLFSEVMAVYRNSKESLGFLGTEEDGKLRSGKTAAYTRCIHSGQLTTCTFIN